VKKSIVKRRMMRYMWALQQLELNSNRRSVNLHKTRWALLKMQVLSQRVVWVKRSSKPKMMTMRTKKAAKRFLALITPLSMRISRFQLRLKSYSSIFRDTNHKR
jgi:hypothetical protein